ncbi:MAG: hypothetical protein EXR78_09635 [Deltaproteobacteria bacterium]|nr:hypothetical protein [Deltaproteobacteria bacterium]
MIIEERGRVSQSQLPDIAFSFLKDQDPSARVLVRGARVVNGKSLLFQEVSAKIDGIDVVFYGHYYSDDSGTIQITGWTVPNLLKEHRITIDGFVAGFQMKD